MKTALVLGGADCLHDDIAAYQGEYQGVVACNDAGAEWPGELDAWVSLHPEFFTHKGWLDKRQGPPPKRLIAHPAAAQPHRRARLPANVEFTEYAFPGQTHSGSSGLFATKVALIDLGFDRAVLCGVPLTQTPHFFGGDPWKAADGFRRQWLALPEEYRDRMRSLSGWTAVLLGKPEIETKETENA
ncbi:hypothetical protein [Roseovarius sp. MMSF_3281]|uniref:hypothetical protein n=1 Tax=Roseovarius sp. MMSF_3281 TaxID=3046694 RepID=UPI00273ED39A|nr:hypothetical protein [Roseovarius sp. MMSF_3281]